MKRYLDLTHMLDVGVVTAPLSWHPPMELELLGQVNVQGSMTHRVTFGTHTGTHIDSPAHMIIGGSPTVEGIPVETLIGKAKILRIPKENDQFIEKADFCSAGVEIEKGDIVLIHTGADRQWNQPEFFKSYPTFTLEAAEYLIKKGVAVVGMDTPSPDRGGLPKEHPMRNAVHKKLLGSGVYVVEALANLSRIPCTEVEAIILPLKIRGLDGCPVRAVAVYEEV